MRRLLGKELTEAGMVGLPALLLLCGLQAGIGVWRQLAGHECRLEGAFWWLPALLVAVAVGLAQTEGENAQGTWAWLLTRPARRWRVLAAKAAAGLGWTLAASGLPLLLTMALVRRPGLLAGPYDPSAFDEWRRALALAPLAWAGALLGGLESAQPLWQRLLTAAGALILALALGAMEWSPARTAAVAGGLAALLLLTAWGQRLETA